MKSYWFDPQHTGALRIIDNNTKTIRSADSNKEIWVVHYTKQDKRLIVDFSKKKGHRGNKIIEATFSDRNNTLLWSDGNKWYRIRVDPNIILKR